MFAYRNNGNQEGFNYQAHVIMGPVMASLFYVQPKTFFDVPLQEDYLPAFLLGW
jgi:hypothetical protein